MLSKSKEIINQLFMLTKTVQIHDVNNNAFLVPLEDFVHELNDFVQSAGPFAIEGIEENIYINEEKVKTDISTFSSFKFILNEFLMSEPNLTKIKLVEVNYERNNLLVKENRVEGVPTTLVFVNKKLRVRHLGEITRNELKSILSNVL